MHSNACAVRRAIRSKQQQAATDDTIAWPLRGGGDRLHRWENQRMMSSSSSLITLARRPSSSSLRITDRSFRICLTFPLESGLSLWFSLDNPVYRFISDSLFAAPATSSYVELDSPLSSSINPRDVVLRPWSWSRGASIGHEEWSWSRSWS